MLVVLFVHSKNVKSERSESCHNFMVYTYSFVLWSLSASFFCYQLVLIESFKHLTTKTLDKAPNKLTTRQYSAHLQAHLIQHFLSTSLCKLSQVKVVHSDDVNFGKDGFVHCGIPVPASFRSC